jgi:RNase P/RNase MRP subunit POP5
MTLSKKKFRYICVYLQQDAAATDERSVYYNFTNKLYERLEGLFGSIDYYKSTIKIINVHAISSKFIIIRCRLEYIDDVLLSLCFTNHSLLILPLSGTIKQLKKRIQSFLSYEEFFIDS